MGQVENARKHLCYPGMQPEPSEMQRLQVVEKHISKCGDVRRVGDWKSVLREVDAAVAAGADSSYQVLLILLLIFHGFRLYCSCDFVVIFADKCD